MPTNKEVREYANSIFETVYGESIQDFVSKELAEKMQAKNAEMQAKNAEMQAEKVQSAQKLLLKDMPIKEVAEIVNLSLKKIKEIKASL